MREDGRTYGNPGGYNHIRTRTIRKDNQGNAICVYTAGSMDEKWTVGVGWYGDWNVAEGKDGLETLATVWDGEVGGMRRGLESMPRDIKVLVLPESQATIGAIKKSRQDRESEDTGPTPSDGRDQEEARGTGTGSRKIWMG